MTPSSKISVRVTLLTALTLAVGRSAAQNVALAPGGISSPGAYSGATATEGIFYLSEPGALAGPLLVIPNKEMDAAAVGRVVEDLTIMARIIRKNSASIIGSDAGSSRLRRFDLMHLIGPDAGPSLLFSDDGQPRPLYVAGYGALFFLRVGFPLFASEEPGPTQQGEGDAVWAETRRSLLDPEPRGLYGSTAARTRRPYSRERADALKSSLTTTLKHAANIRGLEPADWVAIVVQGAPSHSAAAAPGQFASGNTVLTLRSTKANIDLYAKGELGQADFEQRLQVIAH